jgi:hypothetical protein
VARQDLCEVCSALQFDLSSGEVSTHAFHERWSHVVASGFRCHLCRKIRYLIECLQADQGHQPFSHIVDDPPEHDDPEPLRLRVGSRRITPFTFLNPMRRLYLPEHVSIELEGRGLAHTVGIEAEYDDSRKDDMPVLAIIASAEE